MRTDVRLLENGKDNVRQARRVQRMMLGMLCLLKADDVPTFLFETCDSSSQKATELLSSTLAVVVYADPRDRAALVIAEGMVGWIVKNRLLPSEVS